MPAAMPAEILVGPFVYRVSCDPAEWVAASDSVDTASRGLSEHGPSTTIWLNPNMSPTLKRVVLLHEILHACSFAAGVFGSEEMPEEKWVTHVAPMLAGALVDTPGLAKFLRTAAR